jgi:hypothetical protein
MSLKDFVRSGGRKRPGPVCYEIPLSAIAEQLPFDLMKTGMWWIWRSSRQADHTPYCDSALPDKRTPTLLTPDSAAAFAAEFAEHDDEFSRWMLVVGGNGSPPGVLLSAAQMQGRSKVFHKPRTLLLRQSYSKSAIRQTRSSLSDRFLHRQR